MEVPPTIHTATLTPMHQDLTFNGEMLIRHCQTLLKAGSSGIALLGTTGEANSFSLEEKKQIIDTVVEAGVPADQLMVGTGSCAYTETIELTRHALAKGITDILLLPPFYYKQVNNQGLTNYFQRTIENIADDRMRIYLYHFPKMTGIQLSNELIEGLLKLYPEQIVGMKDSSGDLEHMLSVCHNFPGFKLFAGTEKYLLPVLQAGGAGCISATANVTIGKMAELLEAWQSPEAEALQEALTEIRSAFDGLPFTAILKQYLAHQQHDPQWLPIRPPNSLVDNSELIQLLEKLRTIGFI